MKNKLQKAQNILRKTKNILIISAMMLSIASGNAFAAADPLGAINNLSTFIFSAIKTIGLILLAFGIVQIGLSLKSHDASQRANGFLTFFGGVTQELEKRTKVKSRVMANALMQLIKDSSQVFLMGHAEYDPDTLKKEYLRDLNAGLDIQVPKHYFPNDDHDLAPQVSWRSCAHLLYTNWLNYCVYQTTPYDIEDIDDIQIFR